MKMYRKVSVLLVLAMLVALSGGAAALAAEDMTVVKTQFGAIRGDPVADDLVIYRGVPFAAPPVGDLRWRAPVDPQPWEGVRDCTVFNPMAMQIMDVNCFWGEDLWYQWLDEYPNMSEDCLYLQIYSPARTPDANLPIFVWIHGGASRHGVTYDAQAAAEELARRGVIVVEVEYRLGLFGFMASDELDAESETGASSGNYGVMDCIKALEWIQDNIAAFGGDPSRVTVGGQSAGASIVCNLLTSPRAQDLWSGAVMCSSFRPLSTTTSLEREKEIAAGYFDSLGLGDKSLAELRQIPAEYFINPDTALSDYAVGWGACLDGYVLTENPVDFYTRDGVLNGKNLLFGSTSGEGNAEFTIRPEQEIFEAAKNTYGELYDKYNFEYIYRSVDDIESTIESLRLKSEQQGLQNMLNAAYLSKKNPEGHFYPFYFSHWTPGRAAEIRWAWHSADLWYWFDSMRDIPEQRDWTELDYQLGDICSAYWANFAATGDPNGEGLPAWTACTPEALSVLDIGDEVVPRDNFYEGSKQLEGRDKLMLEYLIATNPFEGVFDQRIGE